MEVPTRGAAHRCASVSEGFLHRNCVLFVSSQLPLTVVLRKHIDLLFVEENMNSTFLKSLLFVCNLVIACQPVLIACYCAGSVIAATI